MLPFRSISHIETFFPFFKFRANECHFECTLCTSYVATLTTSDKKEYVFNYDSANGVDFINNHLPCVFRNLKQNRSDAERMPY